MQAHMLRKLKLWIIEIYRIVWFDAKSFWFKWVFIRYKSYFVHSNIIKSFSKWAKTIFHHICWTIDLMYAICIVNLCQVRMLCTEMMGFENQSFNSHKKSIYSLQSIFQPNNIWKSFTLAQWLNYSDHELDHAAKFWHNHVYKCTFNCLYATMLTNQLKNINQIPNLK